MFSSLSGSTFINEQKKSIIVQIPPNDVVCFLEKGKKKGREHDDKKNFAQRVGSGGYPYDTAKERTSRREGP